MPVPHGSAADHRGGQRGRRGSSWRPTHTCSAGNGPRHFLLVRVKAARQVESRCQGKFRPCDSGGLSRGCPSRGFGRREGPARCNSRHAVRAEPCVRRVSSAFSWEVLPDLVFETSFLTHVSGYRQSAKDAITASTHFQSLRSLRSAAYLRNHTVTCVPTSTTRSVGIWK